MRGETRIHDSHAGGWGRARQVEARDTRVGQPGRSSVVSWSGNTQGARLLYCPLAAGPPSPHAAPTARWTIAASFSSLAPVTVSAFSPPLYTWHV